VNQRVAASYKEWHDAQEPLRAKVDASYKEWLDAQEPLRAKVDASYREWLDAQVFLGANVDALVSHQGIMERRYREYYQAYITQVNDMHKLATRNTALKQEVEKAEASTDAADRKFKDLDAVSTDLAERNVSLQQDLGQARERICTLDHRIGEVEVASCELTRVNLALQQDLYKALERNLILESQIAGADPPSADASGLENKAHELDTVEDKENRLDNRETNSTISVASKRESPSPGDGGGQNAEEGKPKAGRGKRGRHRRGKPGSRNLGPTSGLRIACI
jgi:chromosome segregation ATPase